MKVYQGDYALEGRTLIDHPSLDPPFYTYECVQFPPVESLQLIKKHIIGVFEDKPIEANAADIISSIDYTIEMHDSDDFQYGVAITVSARGSRQGAGLASLFVFSSRKLQR